MSATGENVETIAQVLTDNCARVSDWMRDNKFKLNADKTHILTVGTGERLKTLDKLVEAKMDGVVLKETDEKCELLLGIQIQSNLKWHKTLQELQSKLQKRLAGLAKLRYIVPYTMLKIITQGIFNSILIYCLPLFGGCDKGEISALQVLQNKAAPRSPRNFMFERLGWFSVNQLIVYHTLIAVFKIRNSGEPEFLATSLNKDNVVNGHILLPKQNLTLAEKSFTFRGAKAWNLLPFHMRTLVKIGCFKKELKKWVKENVPRFLD